MRQIGTVTRLQVQRSSVKVGLPKQRSYNPSPIHAVPAATLSEAGVMGWDEHGAPLSDVHHRDHPAGKWSGGVNGVSILFTSHYDAMRERFGGHMIDGIAGESILVETEGFIGEEAARRGIVIRTDAGGEARLEVTKVAEPCVEFTRFTIHYPPDAHADDRLNAALTFLRGGMRGYYLRYIGEPVTIRLGDPVFLGTG